ncbi:hypothetical protein AXI64_gp009 [Vibrio phage qdvp001]|uniref:hypothetical protein n=1 Tax=Vibrio phage qdvp001 TaxID=1003177 RepID=UPI000720A5D1|nr:hypothetical protein AXI64_gp009 [Vibrio phage qdvp001]ALM62001.1 hypothetical protein qdvp001_009 [Vibrio phage qdvp001]
MKIKGVNMIVHDLYHFQKYCNLDDYYKYRRLCVDTIGWRLYSFSWKCKYFRNLLVYKMRGYNHEQKVS